jgi:hypothetical protein
MRPDWASIAAERKDIATIRQQPDRRVVSGTVDVRVVTSQPRASSMTGDQAVVASCQVEGTRAQAGLIRGSNQG